MRSRPGRADRLFWHLVALLGPWLVSAHAASVTGTVGTDCGPVQGTSDGYGLWTFLGIPYAAPPIGPLRFQPTVGLAAAKKCWNGTLQAKTTGACCTNKYSPAETTSEDCLFLNVWTSNLHNIGLLPVMLYIHGGALVGGCSGNPYFNPALLSSPTGGVVSVTINYRLSVLGFLSLSVLSQNDQRGVSGNYGFLDIIQALQWVRTNIAAFGGDPNRVTLYGQSSGGTGVFAMLMSPLASGLFHRAISLSGSPLINVTLSQAEAFHLHQYIPSSPCGSSEDLLQCLYEADAMALVQATNDDLWSPEWQFGIPTPASAIAPLAIVDGVVLRSNLTYSLSHDANDVPVIFGNMQEEPDVAPVYVVYNYSASAYEKFVKQRFSAFTPSLGGQVLQQYPLSAFDSPQQALDQVVADSLVICGNIELARQASKHFTSPVYNIITVQGPESPFCNPPDGLGGAAGYCAHYAFHTWDLIAFWDSADLHLNRTDQALHQVFLSRLLAFAYNGTVNHPAWTPFNSSPHYPSVYYSTLVATEEELVTNTRSSKCEFWSRNGFDQFWWQN